LSDRLKLRQLSCFVAVAEELNFRRAAERLFMTQPPLSRQIQALERNLGARLFERGRPGVRLTEPGQRLLADARALLKNSQQVISSFRTLDIAERKDVRIGITTSIDVGLFSWVGTALRPSAEDWTVTVKRQISLRSIRDLDLGALDLAVIGLPARADGLTVEPLCEDPLVACLPHGHPAARKRLVSVGDLQRDRLFWFQRKLNPAYYDYCDRVFTEIGFAPERVAEPTDHAMLLGLVALDQGVALVPKSLTSTLRKGVVFRPLLEDDRLRIRVALVYRPGPMQAPVRALVDLMRRPPTPG